MPVITGRIDANGAIVDIAVGVTDAKRQAMARLGMPVPPMIEIRAVIDTGSSISGFTKGVLESLNETPFDKKNIYTPSTGTTPHECDLYVVSVMLIHEEQQLYFRLVHVIQTEFTPEEGVQALLGRDILDSCKFLYDGPGRTYSITF